MFSTIRWISVFMARLTNAFRASTQFLLLDLGGSCKVFTTSRSFTTSAFEQMTLMSDMSHFIITVRRLFCRMSAAIRLLAHRAMSATFQITSAEHSSLSASALRARLLFPLPALSRSSLMPSNCSNDPRSSMRLTTGQNCGAILSGSCQWSSVPLP